MGVDAEMFVRTKVKITEEQVRTLAYRMGEAFGHDNLWIFKNPDHGESRHCMQIVPEYTQDGPTIQPGKGETFIQVYPCSRYYGEGYERGNLPLLIMIAEWLEANIPGGEVWYGGDSSGVEAKKFDKKAREKLFKFFAKGGHRNYTTFFDKKADGPLCNMCFVRMDQYGFGQNYASYYCAGCGENTMTRDGGKTFEAKNENWEPSCASPFECPSCKIHLVTRDAGHTFEKLEIAKVFAEREKERRERKQGNG